MCVCGIDDLCLCMCLCGMDDLCVYVRVRVCLCVCVRVRACVCECDMYPTVGRQVNKPCSCQLCQPITS